MANEARFDPATVVAAVFDIGGVFTYPGYERVEAHLPTVGVTPPADLAVYRQAHHRAVCALSSAILGVDGVDGLAADETNPDLWDHYDAAYAGHLGVAEADVDELRIAMRASWDWVHEANVAAFHRLAATGLPLAVVSNNDGTAPDQMRDFGVCQVGAGPLPSVAAIVDSTLVGVAKPDPAIFTPAIDALGADPARVLYIGDTVHADVIGATRAGMQVVQLDPFDDHDDFDHPRIADLDALVDVLA